MLDLEKIRALYPENDPVHGFDHVLRVVRLAEVLAQSEGADQEIVHMAALLHDSRPKTQDSMSGCAQRLAHHELSAEIAGRLLEAEAWMPARIQAVQHCILSHRFRDEKNAPLTIEARVLFDADKLDAIGAVGAARAIAYAVHVGQPIFSPPSTSFLRDGVLEPGEPHSAFHEFKFKLIKIKDRLLTLSGRRLAEERHRHMSEFFKALADEIEVS